MYPHNTWSTPWLFFTAEVLRARAKNYDVLEGPEHDEGFGWFYDMREARTMKRSDFFLAFSKGKGCFAELISSLLEKVDVASPPPFFSGRICDVNISLNMHAARGVDENKPDAARRSCKAFGLPDNPQVERLMSYPEQVIKEDPLIRWSEYTKYVPSMSKKPKRDLGVTPRARRPAL